MVSRSKANTTKFESKDFAIGDRALPLDGFTSKGEASIGVIDLTSPKDRTQHLR